MDRRDIWIVLGLLAIARGVRLWLATQLAFPELADPVADMQIARYVAAERGFVSDVILSYCVLFSIFYVEWQSLARRTEWNT